MYYSFFICFFLLANFSFSQVPEAKEYSWKYDSIRNLEVFFEYDSLGQKRLLNNKIIKLTERNLLIKKGLIVEEFEVPKKKENLESVYYEYDSLNSLEKKIYCVGKRLNRFELYKSDYLSVAFDFKKYAITPSISEYEYYDWGYFEYVSYNNIKKKYKVEYDYKLKNILSKELIEENKITEYDIEIDSEGNYYWVANDFDSKSSDIIKKYGKKCMK